MYSNVTKVPANKIVNNNKKLKNRNTKTRPHYLNHRFNEANTEI